MVFAFLHWPQDRRVVLQAAAAAAAAADELVRLLVAPLIFTHFGVDECCLIIEVSSQTVLSLDSRRYEEVTISRPTPRRLDPCASGAGCPPHYSELATPLRSSWHVCLGIEIYFHLPSPLLPPQICFVSPIVNLVRILVIDACLMNSQEVFANSFSVLCFYCFCSWKRVSADFV